MEMKNLALVLVNGVSIVVLKIANIKFDMCTLLVCRMMHLNQVRKNIELQVLQSERYPLLQSTLKLKIPLIDLQNLDWNICFLIMLVKNEFIGIKFYILKA